ncbi:MAG: DUF4351 domain-containing protein [Aquificales bacterium]|nr:DUF4351 domain-containing protein [Aquificales bacterium]
MKLLNYQEKWDELQEDDNPFAVVVMAHLQTQATRKNPQERYAAKFKLAKLLYERGYQRQDIIDLYRFIDWVMALPTELEEQFMSDIIAYETREKKRYVTNIERIAARRGREQGLEQGLEQAHKEMIMRTLERKFGEAPTFIAQQLAPLSVPALDKLFDAALDAETLVDFEQALVVVAQEQTS